MARHSGSLANYVARNVDKTVDELCDALALANMPFKRATVATLRARCLKEQKSAPLRSALRRLVMQYGYRDVAAELNAIVTKLVDEDAEEA